MRDMMESRYFQEINSYQFFFLILKLFLRTIFVYSKSCFSNFFEQTHIIHIFDGRNEKRPQFILKIEMFKSGNSPNATQGKKMYFVQVDDGIIVALS